MIKQFLKAIVIAGIAAVVTACIPLPKNPVAVVGEDQTNLAIRVFFDASARLAQTEGHLGVAVQRRFLSGTAQKVLIGGTDGPYYLCGYDGDASDRSSCSSGATAPPQRAVGLDTGNQLELIGNYVKTGWIASRLVCRNYLAGLSEKNDLFEVLKRQFNITGGLAQLALEIAKASGRAIAIVGAAQSFVNSTIDNLAEFNFLTPDQAALQDLVERAQNVYANYYLSQQGLPKSFSEAINAVHNIEYQCTRAGLRHLISRSLQGTTFDVEPVTGTLRASGDRAVWEPFDGVAGSRESRTAMRKRLEFARRGRAEAKEAFDRAKKVLDDAGSDPTSPRFIAAHRLYERAAVDFKSASKKVEDIEVLLRNIE
jgi:hypothetical protein